MKALLINECDYYLYPETIHTLEEFITYANTHMGRLVPMRMLKEDNCVSPFYVKEDIKQYYINPSRIDTVTEEEVTLLSKEEYEKALGKVVSNVCISCVYYNEDGLCPCEDYQEKLSLDGKCWDFENDEDDENDFDGFDLGDE
ncbi:MAG: hypothetical protein Q4F05_17225 [bacterium]|nr:hypothetical protein [bacterium]